LSTEPQPAWPHATDSQLIDACLAGHETAWAVLIERYSRLIYTIPLRFGFSKVIADEIFQETCLILLEGLETLQDRQRISSWLMTVTRRACIQRMRQPPPTVASPLPDEVKEVDSTIEEDLLRLEQRHLVQQALANLSTRDQQLLRALFFEEPRPPYEEIAQTLGVSVGSIGPLRARSLKRLQQEIIRLENEM
jgi:RNA polymerase sigma factor (sigma-70 family)